MQGKKYYYTRTSYIPGIFRQYKNPGIWTNQDFDCWWRGVFSPGWGNFSTNSGEQFPGISPPRKPPKTFRFWTYFGTFAERMPGVFQNFKIPKCSKCHVRRSLSNTYNPLQKYSHWSIICPKTLELQPQKLGDFFFRNICKTVFAQTPHVPRAKFFSELFWVPGFTRCFFPRCGPRISGVAVAECAGGSPQWM